MLVGVICYFYYSYSPILPQRLCMLLLIGSS